MRTELGKRLAALGLTACVSLSLLALPAWAAEDGGAEETPVTAEPADAQPEETDPGSAEAAPEAADPPAQAAPSNGPALTTEHIRYMQGVPGGKFQPAAPLTRAQAAQMIYRLLTDPDGGTQTASYRDVPDTTWYARPVKALRAWGLFDDGETFRPKANMTRAEFVDLLVRLHPDAQGTASFPDVPEAHWAYRQIGAAVSLGWIQGYPDGNFGPEDTLTRAEACVIVSRVTGRTGDADRARVLLSLGLFSDVAPGSWSGAAIAEASVAHTPAEGERETWASVDYSQLNFTPGFHDVGKQLYYVDRSGTLATDQTLGAYTVRPDGALTWKTLSYQSPDVPYISQLDGLYAWKGSEVIAALAGLRAKGFAQDVTPMDFLNAMPINTVSDDPEKGFVGSPYAPDSAKVNEIYPAKLAEFCNRYCKNQVVCADFRGQRLTALQRELLAGNLVVAYETLWWRDPTYRTYNIDGKSRRMVSNGHAVLVCGYDPEKGYFISDPYNYYNRGESYQYWQDAKTFEKIWNARKMAMVIR